MSARPARKTTLKKFEDAADDTHVEQDARQGREHEAEGHGGDDDAGKKQQVDDKAALAELLCGNLPCLEHQEDAFAGVWWDSRVARRHGDK